MLEVKEIPIAKIDVGEYDVRLDEEDDTIEDLAASIRRIGVIVPLHVVQAGDRFKLVAGHRRIIASQRVGLSTVPCLVHLDGSSDSREVSFAENLFRKDLTPIELASALKDFIEVSKQSVDDVSRMLNRSGEYVRRHLAILTWPEDIQIAIHQGWLSVSAAENLACVTNDSYRDFLLGHAKTNGATARLTSAWLQAWRSLQPPEQAIQKEPIEGQERAAPLVPQAPCIVCSNIFRTDELCHVPCCPSCIRHLRSVGDSLRP